MKKAEVLEKIRSGRERMEAAIAGLDEAEMAQPGVVGNWSVKDLLAHVTVWEAELVTALWYTTLGRRPRLADIRDVDAWNARRYEENKDRPLDRILGDFRGVYEQLLQRVERLSDDELNDPRRYDWTRGRPMLEVIAENSYDHEAEHTAQIEAYRKAKP
jgi:uncharacterized protein (TIGR03083 family)